MKCTTQNRGSKTKTTLIGRLCVPRSISASDGSAVRMTGPGWISPRGIAGQTTALLMKSIAVAILSLTLWLLLVRVALASAPVEGVASWYSSECCQYNPDPKCPTASGRSLYELERNGEYFAAMWNLSIGTRVRVTNLGNRKSVEATILDRGPKKSLGRVADLCRAAFERIEDPKRGICRVMIEVLS